MKFRAWGLAIGLLIARGGSAAPAASSAAAPAPAAAPTAPGASGAPAEAAAADPPAADVGAAIYGYVVPDQPNFVTPVGWADLRWVHVEGHYNYEALHTGSVFLGARWSWGTLVRLRVTPMLGGAFGDVTGVVPALRFSLGWWKVDLCSESELVFDVHDVGASFVYSWNELGISPLAWLRVGAVMQRDPIFLNDLAVQRGLFAGVTLRFASFTLYELNAGWTSPTLVLAVSASF